LPTTTYRHKKPPHGGQSVNFIPIGFPYKKNWLPGLDEEAEGFSEFAVILA
jgi:hypothetical protein